MQLLELSPTELGVHCQGIYVVDDDGIGVIAGPFDSVALAVAWIDGRRSLRETTTSYGRADD